MRKRLALVALAVCLGVFLTAVVGLSRGWYREKIGSFGISGWNAPGWFRLRCSCAINVYLTQNTRNPKEKGVKIFVHAVRGDYVSRENTVDFNTTMSLEEWEEFIGYINLIDEKLHEIWSER